MTIIIVAKGDTVKNSDPYGFKCVPGGGVDDPVAGGLAGHDESRPNEL